LAIAVALPDSAPTLSRPRNVEDFHNLCGDDCSTSGAGCK
jgi:hypothetical protein